MKTCILLGTLLLSFNLDAQTTVTFKDGNQYSIAGELIGTSVTYDLNNPQQVKQKTASFLSEKNGLYQLTFYTTWQTPGMEGRFDELKVYQFSADQLDSNPEVNEETDDNDRVIHYSLKLTAKEETPFQYDVYDFYSPVPKATNTYRYIKVYNDSKEGLTVLAEKLKLPE